MPDLDTFFGFGGTLELLTRDLTLAEKFEKFLLIVVSTLNKHDLVISEIMWAIDEGITNTVGNDKRIIKRSSGLNSTIPQASR